MNKTPVRAGIAAALAIVALAGCGSSTPAATPAAAPSSSATSTKAEDLRTDAAAVSKGLTGISALVVQIAAAPAAQGKTLSDGIEPLWAPVEGTVQANSQPTYDALEAAFTKLESGDVTQAQAGARAAKDAITAYLAKYPG